MNIDNPEFWDEYTLRKNGKYYRKGDKMRSSIAICVGVRREFLVFIVHKIMIEFPCI
jgi:hypothetical protein